MYVLITTYKANVHAYGLYLTKKGAYKDRRKIKGKKYGLFVKTSVVKLEEEVD